MHHLYKVYCLAHWLMVICIVIVRYYSFAQSSFGTITVTMMQVVLEDQAVPEWDWQQNKGFQ